jgi:hypothetical protein
MEQETSSSYDICNLVSSGILGEYKLLYEKVVDLLNKTNAVDKSLDSYIYTKYLSDAKNELDNLVGKFDQLIEKEEQGNHFLRDKCKEKFYQLAGQVYAMYASNNNHAVFEEKALNYYKKYQVLLQRYKICEDLKGRDDIVVYSFRKYSVYTLEDLINETITVVRPSKMNDPFDSIANLWRKTENLKNITGGIGHEVLLNKSMDFFRIRSFQANKKTYDSDEDILRNVKTWSHYADNHYGFCIKYRLRNGFFRRFDEKNNKVLRIAPVKYEEKYSIDNSKKSLDTSEAYYVKSKCWNDENEVRMLSYNPETSEDHYAEPMEDNAIIEEIIFGLLCSEDCKRTLYNLLKTKGVRFFTMKTILHQDIYRIEKEEYIPKAKKKQRRC